MKLYYSPGVCSLSPNIIAHEIGLPLDLEKVDTKAKRTETGRDFLAINPKGYVPVLELDNGELLTEGPAIVQYVADQKPESGIAPPNGTLARSRLQEMLGYINSEIHKTYSPFFKADTPAETLAERTAYLRKRYQFVEDILAKQEWLMGDKFGLADAYLFVVTNWARGIKFDLSDFPALQAFQKRVAERPAVQAAMAAEGLTKNKVAA
ncbi:MAG: glutathione transferase GstA [Rudaea sp.]|uniref:glutathione transferase GstA n=1 Tax=unclassified Rudaea TaxID=2627037 RepID=UPI0010FA574A|nr:MULTISPECIES: glutathione transferase GstA [unclassified Rudaea]MBN8884243.1 glutathione transferase GstA [Rudaea sp.]MBR0344101.1 glutathione transferase GstA [Rudaea sp.]